MMASKAGFLRDLKTLAGCCDEAVEAMLANGWAVGVRRDGVWTGRKPKNWGWKGSIWRTDRRGRPVHVWIEKADGTVVDPTRWVFEGVWPYVYEGPADHYSVVPVPITDHAFVAGGGEGALEPRYCASCGQHQAMHQATKPDLVQTLNPRSGHYIKIDRSAGMIISHKRTAGPYKGIPIAKARS